MNVNELYDLMLIYNDNISICQSFREEMETMYIFYFHFSDLIMDFGPQPRPETSPEYKDIPQAKEKHKHLHRLYRYIHFFIIIFGDQCQPSTVGS